MRFTFATEPGESGVQLPLIPEIGDGRILLLEGRNGIGKSLAVRLLELAIGGMPFAGNDTDWRTLREVLGRTTIDAYTDGGHLQFVVHPTELPLLSTERPTSGLEAFIDGTAVDLDTARDSLDVVRIAGEETLPQALAGRFHRLAREITGVAERAVQRADTLRDALDTAIDAVEAAHIRRLEDALAARSTAVAAATELAEASERCRERRRVVKEAIEARQALGSLEEQGPALRARIEALDADRRSIDQERASAVAQIALLTSQHKRHEALSSELERIERLIRRRERAADRKHETVAALAGALGLPEDAAAVAIAVDEATNELREHSAERADLERADAVRAVVTEILTAITTTPGLADHTPLFHLAGIVVSPLALRRALEHRVAELNQGDIAERVDALDQQIATLVERLEDLATFEQALADYHTASDRIGEALQELETLQIEADAHDVDAFRSAREALDDLVEKAQAIAGDLVGARYALNALTSGHTAEELSSLVESAATYTGTTDDSTLRRVFDEASAELAALEVERALADEHQNEAELALASVETARNTALERLDIDASLEWLSASFDLDAVSSWSADQFDLASSCLHQARERLAAAARNLRGVPTALMDVADHLASGSGLRPDGGIRDAVIKVCEASLKEYFSDPQVRHALFGGNALQTVSIRERNLTWTAGGRPMLRTLTSFSSGEQAFAYAQARIGQLEPLPEGGQRLLVLDEFSAFIAGDRRADLYRLLAEVLARGAASQVVLIVPLSRDYLDDAVRDSAENDPELKSFIDQIERRGYFTREVATNA